MGLLDTFSGLGNLDDTQTQGLLAAASSMLQNSGPSRTPTSFGQVLGSGLEAYQGSTIAAKKRKMEEEHAKNLAAYQGLQMQEMQGNLQDRTAQRTHAEDVRNFYLNNAPASQPTAGGAGPFTHADGQAAYDAAAAAGIANPTPEQLNNFMAGSRKAQQNTPAQGQQAQPAQGAFDQRMSMADKLRNAGLHAEADAMEEKALKFKPEYSQDFKQAIGPDGKLHNYVLSKDGTRIDTGLGVKPDMTEVSLNDRKMFVDKNAVSNGQQFKVGVSPDTVYSGGITMRGQNMTDARAKEAGAKVDPVQTENLAQMIATGRMAPLGQMALRSPAGVAIMSRVAELNPEYRAQTYGTGSKAEKDFATGKQGNSVRSFNVSLSHLDTLDSLADALHNKDLQAINKVGNFIATQTGNPAPTNFEAAKKIVADEVVKAIVGSGGGVHDREEAAKTIAAASSPAQLKGVISTYKELMRGQLHGLEDQYKASTGRDDFSKYLSPQAQAASHGTNAPAAQPTKKSAIRGQVQDGYRFKGGDASKQENWEKV